MKELYNDIDDKSREAARNIRIPFDDNAWDKMEALLNEENRKPRPRIILDTLTPGKEGNKTRRWLQLFLVFLLTGAVAIFSIRNKNPLQNKTPSLVNNNNEGLNTKAGKTNGEKTIDSRAKGEQRTNEYRGRQQSGKNKTGNKNFRPKAAIDKIITLPVTPNSRYKKEEKTNNKKIETIAKKDYFFKVYDEVQEDRKNNLSVSKQGESNGKVAGKNIQSESREIDDTNQQKVKVPLTINKKDAVYAATVRTRRRSSASLKNKFLKNIGFSVFVSPEVNTVKFKASDNVTLNSGAGINYTIGKHFTLQGQFVKSRKVYVTDRKGYNPAAGSPLIPIDTLKVNADCKVWDIPVNVRYSFTGNIRSSFFISAGISSYIMKKEIYNFAFYNQGVYETKQRILENENKHSFCNLNLSAGYQYWLNKKWSIGFEPYFKLPLNGIGAGKVRLTSAGTLFSLTFKPL